MWLAFLTRNDLLIADNLPKELNDPNLKKAINVLSVMNFTPEEREAYEDHLKWLRIEANTIRNYEQRGEIRGKAEGKAEGRVERNIEIAKKMLSKNHSISDISDLIGLSPEDISKL